MSLELGVRSQESGVRIQTRLTAKYLIFFANVFSGGQVPNPIRQLTGQIPNLKFKI